MSQRLLLSLKENITGEDDRFDCVYTEESDLQTLLREWLCYDPDRGFYLGPWKITVRDWDHWDEFLEDFSQIKDYCSRLSSFDDVWCIWDDRKNEKIHISETEEKKYMGIIQAVLNHEDKKS